MGWHEEIGRAARSALKEAMSSWSGLARLCVLLLSSAVAGAVFLAVFHTVRQLG
jgi:hypothetical protein